MPFSVSYSRSKTFSALLRAAGLGRGRRSPINRHSLMGMGGTFGRGRIRHCATWDFDFEQPRSAVGRPDLLQQIRDRREQAAFGPSSPKASAPPGHDRRRR